MTSPLTHPPERREIAPEALIDRPAQSARASLRPDVVDEYAAALQDGTVLPAPTAFTDGEHYWLADGRHRVEAWRRAHPGKLIEVDVHQGGELDALRHALGANAHHGARRSPGDLQAAFAAAVRAGLVDATDVTEVRELLGCSQATAYRLTEQARATDRERRDAMIAGLRGAGASTREVARQIGVDQATVSRAERVRNSHEKIASPRPRQGPTDRRAPPPRPMQLPPAAPQAATLDERRAVGLDRVAIAVSCVAELERFDLIAAVAVLDARQRQHLVDDLQRSQRILTTLAEQLDGGRRA